MENKKDCKNCHWRTTSKNNCFDGEPYCFENPEHPLWQPKTNGDCVREMDDNALANIWARIKFPDENIADCDKCGRVESCGFIPEACPETFRSWLGSPIKELKWN